MVFCSPFIFPLYSYKIRSLVVVRHILNCKNRSKKAKNHNAHSLYKIKHTEN
jgi:hypothetical protein